MSRFNRREGKFGTFASSKRAAPGGISKTLHYLMTQAKIVTTEYANVKIKDLAYSVSGMPVLSSHGRSLWPGLARTKCRLVERVE
jgi:hypothetical protein